MKISKFLTICFVVCCMFVSSVFGAACTKELGDALAPNEDTFSVGDTINYTITLSIPPNDGATVYCSLANFKVDFLNPALATSTSACGDASSVELYTDVSFDPGEIVTFTGPGLGGDVEDAALSYVIQEGDLLDGTTGKVIVALLCSSWDGALGRDVDNKSLVNYVINPAVCVTKVPDCDEEIEDENVVYTITIENCGDTTLDMVSVQDSLLGDLVTSGYYDSSCDTLDPNDTCTFDVPYLVTSSDTDPLINVVDVNYLVVGSSLTVTDIAQADVDIVHPSFTVDKVCQSPNDYVLAGSDANFVITVTNTGDVPLDFTSAELGSFTLDESGGTKDQEIRIVPVPTTEANCDGGVSNQVSVKGEYTGGTDDCLEWDDTVTSEPVAVCNVACPEFEIEKNCLGDVDFDTDPNAYFEIIIRNLGNVPLDFAVIDSNAIFDPPVVFPITIQNSGETTLYAKIAVLECGEPIVNNVEVVGWYISEEIWIDIQTDTAECPCEEKGDEGCTPGFWKNHTQCWCGDYSPIDPVAGVFTALQDPNYAEFQGDSLLDALKYGGGRGLEGAARNLLRHATAALLNTCSEKVEYEWSSVAELIDDVNEALMSLDRRTITGLQGDLQWANEAGCPIDAFCRRDPDDPKIPKD